MTDRLTKEKRSWNMSRIRSKDTSPEMRVRSYLHKAGFRFRLHGKELPGRPDIILPKYETVIFVHGCYWHRHIGCKLAYMPKTRVEFWQEKFRKNVERDRIKEKKLLDAGWTVLTVWECMTRDDIKLREVLDCLFVKRAAQ